MRAKVLCVPAEEVTLAGPFMKFPPPRRGRPPTTSRGPTLQRPRGRSRQWTKEKLRALLDYVSLYKQRNKHSTDVEALEAHRADRAKQLKTALYRVRPTLKTLQNMLAVARKSVPENH